MSNAFPTLTGEDLERGEVLAPRFDANGLMAAIAQHAETKEILMIGWMNEEALRLTLAEGRVVYFSRSRNVIWRKGEESGQVQVVKEIRIDCDQDAVLLQVLPGGDGGACHTGLGSCFYRRIEDGRLVMDPLP
ncbi:MAG: phosphoribosyl-AMP cyclohydrolase [Caulobacteraceae bacterium]|mgnify:CR=1 FL=1